MPGLPVIVRASGSHAFSENARFLDLINGFGAVFLGHGHPRVAQALRDQLERVWLCARYPTDAAARADTLIREILPPGMKHAGLYSTGMEASEFALRLAAVHTGRNEFIGFSRNMHGKSALTAALCWSNAPIRSETSHMLPFVAEADEKDVLGELERALSSRAVAAVIVEPIQGSNGAREASAEFVERMIALCREHGSLCIFDEILTGLYRTGTRFYSDRLRAKPDVLLFAKSMGNGFPVSSVAIRDDIGVPPAALPGSTFSGNPLACAAVVGTLETMRELPMSRMVEDIERVVRSAFDKPQSTGVTLRGRGALWALELDQRIPMEDVLSDIQKSGMLVSSYGRHIRLLPAATIDLAELRAACAQIARHCAAAFAPARA